MEFAGDNTLFLALNPATVGAAGCLLMATIAEPVTGTSGPYALGRVMLLPRIDRFGLSDHKVGEALYAGILTGQNLQMIEKTGWGPKSGRPAEAIPTSLPADPGKQTLEIVMRWPPPSPQAPLHIWLCGENEGRATNAKYWTRVAEIHQSGRKPPASR
jgi:hypothetical protein